MSFECPFCVYKLCECPLSVNFLPPVSLADDDSFESLPPCVLRFRYSTNGNLEQRLSACKYQWKLLKKLYIDIVTNKAGLIIGKDEKTRGIFPEKDAPNAAEAFTHARESTEEMIHELSKINEDSQQRITKTIAAIAKSLGRTKNDNNGITGCDFIDNLFFPNGNLIALGNAFLTKERTKDSIEEYSNILKKYISYLMVYLKMMSCCKTQQPDNIL